MEENQLFEDVDKIIECAKEFRQRIEFAETSWNTESEALRLFESQVKVCETIRDLVEEEKYAEAFILNRTIFENYLMVSLILKGTKYILKYKVPIRHGESARDAYNRLVKELEKQCKEGRRDIVSFRPIKGFRQIEIVHRGLYSQEGDKLIPVYHFVFMEYDPIRHRIDKIKPIASKNLYPDIAGKWQKKHEALYKTYFGFRNLLKATVLNEILTDEQEVRVRVHYNFLSAFTHLTKMGFDLSMPYEAWKSRHYLIELNLLYVLRILRLYILLLIEFFTKTEHRIKNVDRLVAYLEELGKKYDCFWFIFNGPSAYDFWEYRTTMEYRRRKGELLDAVVPYYKDPYHRLRKQHHSTTDLLTGLGYTSPWPRRDAIP